MSTQLIKTGVDLGGLMRVLGEALYSTPHVVVRELVQNAHDSIVRRSVEDGDGPTPKIHVEADPKGNQLHIEDNGAGLTAEEVRAYLATVGSGRTRVLRDEGRGSGMIGYFGLGFLSAFVVAERTEVWTCSYQTPDSAWRFVSRGGETYTLEQATNRAIGTRVTLHLKGSNSELSDPAVIRSLLQRYCCLLRHPIVLAGETLNAEPPPWRQNVSPLRARKLAAQFAQRFETQFEPITAWPAIQDSREDEVDSSESRPEALRGMFWIHAASTYATSDNRNVSVFVRGMLISDKERDLLPLWAGFMGAAFECDTLLPTASRETLQRNAEFDRITELVCERLVRDLARMATTEPENWRRVLRFHNEALRGAALSDPRLYDVLVDDLTLPTSSGELTLPAVLEKSGGKIYVTQTERGGFEELLFRALKVPVLYGHRYATLALAQRYAQNRRGTLVLLGTKDGDATLMQPQSVDAVGQARLERIFGKPDRQVVLSRFEPTFLPMVLVRDQEAELKRRIEADDADQRIGSAVLSLARQFTSTLSGEYSAKLHVNAGCPAIRALLASSDRKAEVAGGLLAPLAELLAEPDGDQDVQAAFEEYSTAISAVLSGDI